jgi:hypothetical protein
MSAVAIGVVLFIALLLFLYIWLFIFIHGSAPMGRKYDAFVFTISSPTGMADFVKTVFSFGYLKSSFKRFCRSVVPESSTYEQKF